jgi:hypothetical protein
MTTSRSDNCITIVVSVNNDSSRVISLVTAAPPDNQHVCVVRTVEEAWVDNSSSTVIPPYLKWMAIESSKRVMSALDDADLRFPIARDGIALAAIRAALDGYAGNGVDVRAVIIDSGEIFDVSLRGGKP